MAHSTRVTCAQAIYAVLEERRSLQDVLPEALAKHSDKDKAWVHEMLFGVLRQLPLLQWWLKQLLSKPLKPKQRIIEHLLLLGFYQLHFSRVSSHAAVSETVQACIGLKQGPLKGLVNGVLRNFIRQEIPQQPLSDERIQMGLPKWLYKKLSQQYPEQLADIVTAHQQKPPIWLRVNQRKISTTEYKEKLTEQAIEFVSYAQPETLQLSKSYPVASLPGYEEGWFSVQDGAPQLAARYLNPRSGEDILDACAAPGGKTSHLIEYAPEVASLTAVEIEQDRIARMRENFDRLGHSKDIVIIQGNAKTPTEWTDKQYDRILLDAPCSATGIIRRHPDILWLRNNQDIQQLVAEQAQILDAIWSILKPGGTLLYATCSILPEENTLQINSFMARHQDVITAPLRDDSNDFQRQILPGESGMDGFYYAKLIKTTG
ncbi:MAG: 16S rRNA (cytosine(967)-C(5))-methyltransferase RsmB [Aestuariibacter sp.]